MLLYSQLGHVQHGGFHHQLGSHVTATIMPADISDVPLKPAIVKADW